MVDCCDADAATAADEGPGLADLIAEEEYEVVGKGVYVAALPAR